MNLESVLNFGALQFYLYNMDRQSQMVYLLQVLCLILNYVGAWTCLFWLTCQPLLLETMVQDIETNMKVSVHAQLQEAGAGQNVPFSFNLGYLILGMCYLLCDLTFCKGVVFNLMCFTGS